MFCTNCGKELEAGDVFCVHCGARLELVPEAIVAEPVQSTEESPATPVLPVSGTTTAGEGASTSMKVTAPTLVDNWKHNKGIRNLIIMGIFILWLFGVFSPIVNFIDELSGPPPMVGLSMLLTAAIDVGGILFIMVILLGALILSFPFRPLLSPRIFSKVTSIYGMTDFFYPFFIFVIHGDFFINIMGVGNTFVLLICFPFLFMMSREGA